MAIDWNDWIQYVEHSSRAEIAEEAQKIELSQTIPYVEKKLKLGYLYFKQDLIGTATNVFQEVKERIIQEKHNSAFIQENEQGLKILKMSASGRDCIISVTPKQGDFCGPICGCMGIAAVMAICGITAQDVCDYNSATGEESGCIPDAGNALCNCCCGWYNAGRGGPETCGGSW